MAWLRANQSIAGAVLAEYDSAFTNSNFDTPQDDAASLSAAGIAGAAIVLAQALGRLAQSPNAPPLQVQPMAI